MGIPKDLKAGKFKKLLFGIQAQVSSRFSAPPSSFGARSELTTKSLRPSPLKGAWTANLRNLPCWNPGPPTPPKAPHPTTDDDDDHDNNGASLNFPKGA